MSKLWAKLVLKRYIAISIWLPVFLELNLYRKLKNIANHTVVLFFFFQIWVYRSVYFNSYIRLQDLVNGMSLRYHSKIQPIKVTKVIKAIEMGRGLPEAPNKNYKFTLVRKELSSLNILPALRLGDQAKPSGHRDFVKPSIKYV